MKSKKAVVSNLHLIAENGTMWTGRKEIWMLIKKQKGKSQQISDLQKKRIKEKHPAVLK